MHHSIPWSFVWLNRFRTHSLKASENRLCRCCSGLSALMNLLIFILWFERASHHQPPELVSHKHPLAMDGILILHKPCSDCPAIFVLSTQPFLSFPGQHYGVERCSCFRGSPAVALLTSQDKVGAFAMSASSLTWPLKCLTSFDSASPQPKQELCPLPAMVVESGWSEVSSVWFWWFYGIARSTGASIWMSR